MNHHISRPVLWSNLWRLSDPPIVQTNQSSIHLSLPVPTLSRSKFCGEIAPLDDVIDYFECDDETKLTILKSSGDSMIYRERGGNANTSHKRLLSMIIECIISGV
eukprot:scaffold29329_cov53-Cyclotella_meneghiniana.AAC.1